MKSRVIKYVLAVVGVTVFLSGCQQRTLILNDSTEKISDYYVSNFRFSLDYVKDQRILSPLKSSIEETLRSSLTGEIPADVLVELAQYTGSEYFHFYIEKNSLHTIERHKIDWSKLAVKISIKDSSPDGMVFTKWFTGNPDTLGRTIFSVAPYNEESVAQAFAEKIKLWLTP